MNKFTIQPLLAMSGLLLTAMLSFAGSASSAGNAHDFSFTAIEGGTLPLSRFQGKLVMVVNTASQCGFTPQYEGLQTLYEKYQSKGFVVLGVPSNDFGGQEPGTAAEIKEFCETSFAVDFPMADKTAVRGEAAHPFYRWARDEYGALAAPRWNFHKYLVNGDGELVDWFSTATEPGSSRIARRIEEILATQK
ncbi:redoxin domain-containing protein [Alphaproteobacteria bacterium HT1-32]|nr:redoxin domain-containing protein [Alphaproteobacteria bacterium HT1-32]